MDATTDQISGVYYAMSPSAAPSVPAVHTAKKTLRVGTMRLALASNQAGWWTSDHRSETEKFVGWHYVAIRALAMQAAQATVAVYDDSAIGQARAKSIRTFIRSVFGSRWKSQAADNEPAATPLPDDHRLARLHKRPNPWQSGAMFRYEQVLQLSLTGSCMIVKIPNGVGQTVERYVVPTAICAPMPPMDSMPRGGYYINPAAANQWATRMDAQGFVEQWGYHRLLGMVIPIDQFIIIRWPHALFKSDGQSPVSAGALWTDTAEMVDRSRHSHLKNGPDASLVVTAPEGTDPDEAELDRAANRFNSKYAGPNNHGKAIFTSGGTITNVSATPKEMVYELGFSQLRDAIMALHGVTPVAAGILDPGSYAQFYSALKGFVTLTVQPTLSVLAEEETIQQAPEFGKMLTVEMEAASVDDPEVTERMLGTDGAFGIRTVNEARAIRGLTPVEWGDVPLGKAQGGAPIDAIASGIAQPGDGSVARGDLAIGGDQQPGGAFADTSRLQWKRNIKAIRDVVEAVQAGTFSDTQAAVMLRQLGLPDADAQALVDDAKDGRVDDPANAELLNGSGRLNLNGKSLHRLNGHRFGSDDDWMMAAVKALR